MDVYGLSMSTAPLAVGMSGSYAVSASSGWLCARYYARPFYSPGCDLASGQLLLIAILTLWWS